MMLANRETLPASSVPQVRQRVPVAPRASESCVPRPMIAVARRHSGRVIAFCPNGSHRFSACTVMEQHERYLVMLANRETSESCVQCQTAQPSRDGVLPQWQTHRGCNDTILRICAIATLSPTPHIPHPTPYTQRRDRFGTQVTPPFPSLASPSILPSSSSSHPTAVRPLAILPSPCSHSTSPLEATIFTRGGREREPSPFWPWACGPPVRIL